MLSPVQSIASTSSIIHRYTSDVEDVAEQVSTGETDIVPQVPERPKGQAPTTGRESPSNEDALSQLMAETQAEVDASERDMPVTMPAIPPRPKNATVSESTAMPSVPPRPKHEQTSPSIPRRPHAEIAEQSLPAAPIVPSRPAHSEAQVAGKEAEESVPGMVAESDTPSRPSVPLLPARPSPRETQTVEEEAEEPAALQKESHSTPHQTSAPSLPSRPVHKEIQTVDKESEDSIPAAVAQHEATIPSVQEDKPSIPRRPHAEAAEEEGLDKPTQPSAPIIPSRPTPKEVHTVDLDQTQTDGEEAKQSMPTPAMQEVKIATFGDLPPIDTQLQKEKSKEVHSATTTAEEKSEGSAITPSTMVVPARPKAKEVEHQNEPNLDKPIASISPTTSHHAEQRPPVVETEVSSTPLIPARPKTSTKEPTQPNPIELPEEPSIEFNDSAQHSDQRFQNIAIQPAEGAEKIATPISPETPEFPRPANSDGKSLDIENIKTNEPVQSAPINSIAIPESKEEPQKLEASPTSSISSKKSATATSPPGKPSRPKPKPAIAASKSVEPPKPKPPVLAKPGGSTKFNNLRAMFAADLNAKLAQPPKPLPLKKPAPPPSEREESVTSSASLLSDSRKGRAKGPQRKSGAAKPAALAHFPLELSNVWTFVDVTSEHDSASEKATHDAAVQTGETVLETSTNETKVLIVDGGVSESGSPKTVVLDVGIPDAANSKAGAAVSPDAPSISTTLNTESLNIENTETIAGEPE